MNRERIQVGITLPKKELDDMRRASHVDLNGPAVLAMARKGLEAEKAKKAEKAK